MTDDPHEYPDAHAFDGIDPFLELPVVDDDRVPLDPDNPEHASLIEDAWATACTSDEYAEQMSELIALNELAATDWPAGVTI